MSHAWTTRGAVAIAALVLCAPAGAEVINAAPGADVVAIDGTCTLREAVNAANSDTGTVDCSPGFGPDVIMLAAGSYPLSGAAGEAANATGDIDVTSAISFVGAGAGNTTIDVGHHDRAIDVQAGNTVSIGGVTITAGQAPDGSGGSMGNPPVDGEPGGGIRNAGNLTLDGVTITQNSAGGGGQGQNNSSSGGNGGGISSAVGGTLTITNSVIQGNHAGAGGAGGGGVSSGGSAGTGGAGGGVFADTATITDSTITGNSAGNGGAGGVGTTSPSAGAHGGDGGGIFGDTLTLTRTTVSANNAGNGGTTGADPDGANSAQSGHGGAGGGIKAQSSLTLTDATVTGNHAGDGGSGGSGSTSFNGTGAGGAGGVGGGLVVPSSGTIAGSTVAGNSAGAGGFSSRGDAGPGGDGGGLFVENAAIATIGTSVVNGNTSGNGGGVSTIGTPDGGGRAGGIFIDNNASVTATNVTIAENSTGIGGDGGLGTGGSGGSGGGIALAAFATLGLTHVTLAANKTGAGGGGNANGPQGHGGGVYSENGATSVMNSIVASNVPENCFLNAPGDMSDGGRDVLFGNGGTACPLGTAVMADPLLGALADNGGRTKTMALGDGSPAIDLVPPQTGCTPTDQRGVTRPQFNACDAGAFELAPPPPPPPTTETPGGGSQTPAGSGEQPATTTPATSPPDKTLPKVKLRLTKQKLRKALKKGYFAFFTTNELGSAAGDLFASGKDAKGTAAKRTRVAHGTLKVTKTGKQKLVVRFTKRAKKAFAKRKKVTLTLVLTVKDAAGNLAKKTAKVTLKR